MKVAIMSVGVYRGPGGDSTDLYQEFAPFKSIAQRLKEESIMGGQAYTDEEKIDEKSLRAFTKLTRRKGHVVPLPSSFLR